MIFKGLPMTSIKAVIFDLDDTLIHSGINYKEIKSNIIEFLVKAGVDSSLLKEDMPNIEIIGVAVEDLRKKGVPESAVKKVLHKVNAILDEAEMKSLDDAKLMENALEVLEILKKRGLKVGVVTNGCRKYADKVTKLFSLEKYVDVLVARDDVPSPKPSPGHLLKALEILCVPADKAVFVGDHWIDAVCAKKAGVKFIFFKNKKWDIKCTESIHDEVVDDLRTLITLI